MIQKQVSIQDMPPADSHTTAAEFAPSPLRDLFVLGERMRSALQEDDLEHYHRLVQERGTLLDSLRSYEHPSQLDENWRELVDVLRRQQSVLMEEAVHQERRMQHALARLEQLKSAGRSYQGASPRRNILDKNLRV